MKIQGIHTRRVAVPLIKPFKTALRTVHTAEAIIVQVIADNGMIGWGEAPPTHAITGESLESIEAFIARVTPILKGREIVRYECLFPLIFESSIGNSSAKAAVEMALHDLIAQQAGLPLYQWLGGYRDELETDCTVSIGSPEEMSDDAAEYIHAGFNVLKIKVGLGDVTLDLKRIKEVRRRIGSGIKIRLDANQGWEPKAAIRIIREMEDGGLNIELVEQPVKAWDIAGLQRVTEAVDTLIMADEMVFSPADALEVLQRRAADLINIKLMKAGGIARADTICRMAESSGVACMVGSMIETRVGITAAAHFAASKRNVTRFDLDAPLLLAKDIVEGGIKYEGSILKLGPRPGLGISKVDFPC